MSSVARFVRTVARISRTRYPAFVLGRPLAPDEIPVFIYHDVSTADLARDLEFLRSNDYRTLNLEEYLAARERGVRPGRYVLLTFDDARKSFANVALPLLREFEACAVLFVPTYWIQAAGAAADLFMSWEQVRACVASGLVDVQAHAHRHALVAVGPRVIDFANPAALTRFDVYDWPMRHLNGEDELGWPALGTPVYTAAPLLSARHRYLESTAATRACRELVARHGARDFFLQPDWRARLERCWREHIEAAPGRFLDDAAFEALVASEFDRCREAFEQHLGYAPECIAYPWMLGSRRSLELARHRGFRHAFGVAMDYRAERRRDGLPIPAYGRLKCDWLRFLPGERRASVLGAVRRKLSGFGTVQHLAH